MEVTPLTTHSMKSMKSMQVRYLQAFSYDFRFGFLHTNKNFVLHGIIFFYFVARKSLVNLKVQTVGELFS